ncbi:high-affinity branched-chain amino acid ABC transporter permease LivM [Magnetospirillum sulfuroxidans]|uniref:High-affinity branched-chain amino acid ABC transporter permease LivM n=1 Tax=Magnetospirillum sulfuroxidans TaxID=611300 RepID=A0ABS5IAF9_9PROT|nr:high-affinity branched-chain amino acid ABC transporter permease LivM [Magnetospirillum sulfuroxidans]MBR9970733.1 high-affinity branched-chain amino acid ABC transporter permease LivM [Magnetospirillum sulfuroxidans]
MAGVNMTAALRDGVIGAVVAAALALPMLGFRLVDSSQALTLSTRFDWVAWAALAVGLGRFALALLRDTLPGRLPALPDWGARFPKMRLYVGWGMAGFAFVLPFLPIADRALVDKATMVLIYVMLGWGLNIVVGLAGLLDLGFVAFYAVGAYSYALLATKLDLSFWVSLPLAGVFAAGFGIMLGFPVLRLRGDYLAIVTLGFGEIIRVILQNWQDFTNGPAGIGAIPRPSLFGLVFTANAPEGKTTFADYFGLDFSGNHRVIFLYFIILVLALLTNLFTLRIRRLPIGRAWEALREDEIACRSLGLNPTTIKLSAFATGAMFAGFAGSFFATRQGFISPESFTFIESAVILAIVVLGGMGSQIGVVLAALLLVGLPEWFRELQQYRMLAFGGAMVLIMLWKPSGLLAHRSPTIRLNQEAG